MRCEFLSYSEAYGRILTSLALVLLSCAVGFLTIEEAFLTPNAYERDLLMRIVRKPGAAVRGQNVRAELLRRLLEAARERETVLFPVPKPDVAARAETGSDVAARKRSSYCSHEDRPAVATQEPVINPNESPVAAAERTAPVQPRTEPDIAEPKAKAEDKREVMVAEREQPKPEERIEPDRESSEGEEKVCTTPVKVPANPDGTIEAVSVAISPREETHAMMPSVPDTSQHVQEECKSEDRNLHRQRTPYKQRHGVKYVKKGAAKLLSGGGSSRSLGKHVPQIVFVKKSGTGLRLGAGEAGLEEKKVPESVGEKGEPELIEEKKDEQSLPVSAAATEKEEEPHQASGKKESSESEKPEMDECYNPFSSLHLRFDDYVAGSKEEEKEEEKDEGDDYESQFRAMYGGFRKCSFFSKMHPLISPEDQDSSTVRARNAEQI